MKILKKIIQIFNIWSFAVLCIFNQCYPYWLKNDYSGIALWQTNIYKFLETAIGWYINVFTLLATYFICTLILALAVTASIFHKKDFFAQFEKRYLLIQIVFSATNVALIMTLFI